MEGIQKKVVVIGPSGKMHNKVDAGKTALTLRYVNGNFLDSTSSTIGASFLMKKIVMGGNKLTLQIWDTAGQERFKSMAALYFRSSAAGKKEGNKITALLVFDLTKSDSLEQLEGWIEELKKHVGSDIVLAVAGNKCDLNERAITAQKGQEFAKKYNAPYFDTSAKNGSGVQEAFTYIAKQLLKANESAPLSNNNVSQNPATVAIQPVEAKKGGGGCC